MALQFKLRFSDGGVPDCHLWSDEAEEGERTPNSTNKDAYGKFNNTVKKKNKKTQPFGRRMEPVMKPAGIWNSPKFVGTEAFGLRSCPSPLRQFLQLGSRFPEVRVARLLLCRRGGVGAAVRHHMCAVCNRSVTGSPPHHARVGVRA